ncbi:hypothetical protein ACJBSL_11520, partial [Streptococcus suis]
MKRILTVAMVALLSACSSQIQLPDISDVLPEQELDRSMYLRGDFNLWDAETQYEFAQVAPALYQAN